jgi:DNA-binding NtrC family response regulator
LLDACGEKLLVLGRGIRFQSRHTPRAASVLLYLPQTATGRTLTDPNLESALTEAGHAVRAATTSADLESALRSGNFDVVLANITDAPDLERVQAVVERKAFVLPAVYLVDPAQSKQAKADRESASKAFGVVVEVPGRPGHYCAAVDKALELKIKRERSSSARRP